jgi:anti-sigma-K factor RskA
MNYTNRPLIERLAAEYVVGTLRGAARRRFAGLLAGSLLARRAVGFWENRLAALALAIKPVRPPPTVWIGIERSLGFASPQPEPAVLPEQRTDTPARSVLWQALAAGFAAVAIGLGAWMLTHPSTVTVTTVETTVPTPVQPDFVAVITDAMALPIWLLSAYPDAGTLEARALNVAPPADNQVFELWMLPNGGAAPVSLGVLPMMGEIQLLLDAARIAVLANTATLAVSVEPAGGSPTGAPTGPVVFTAPLVGA